MGTDGWTSSISGAIEEEEEEKLVFLCHGFWMEMEEMKEDEGLSVEPTPRNRKQG